MVIHLQIKFWSDQLERQTADIKLRRSSWAVCRKSWMRSFVRLRQRGLGRALDRTTSRTPTDLTGGDVWDGRRVRSQLEQRAARSVSWDRYLLFSGMPSPSPSRLTSLAGRHREIEPSQPMTSMPDFRVMTLPYL